MTEDATATDVGRKEDPIYDEALEILKRFEGRPAQDAQRVVDRLQMMVLAGSVIRASEDLVYYLRDLES